MANYVYNYLFCDEKAKDRMMILDGDDCSLLNGCYDIIVTPIKDSRFLVIFETRGMEYREEFIKRFIREYRDTKWYCIEENEVEQGFYFWNGTQVELNKRKLVETLGTKEIRIRYEDSGCRPFLNIFISDKIIAFENYLENKMKRYSFSDKSRSKINDYLNFILSEKSDKYDAVLIKGGIGREIHIHWEAQTYFIDHVDENDNRRSEENDGEAGFDSITLFFNSILNDEGIEESVSFELKGI